MEVNGHFHTPAALTLGKRPPRTHYVGGWMGPTAGLTLWIIMDYNQTPTSRPRYTD
jgi:hypothetical protein